MQRESQQCESLQKELQKLRESRTGVLKAQKQQAMEYQKFKKEQQAKLELVKKADMKKKKEVESLRGELTKKSRVLGHKEKEIIRINSKLKTCEEHISHLLKIQNKNRNRNLGAGSGPSSGPGGLNTSLGGIAGLSRLAADKDGLTVSEIENLLSSKSMLDNLIKDRVERRRTRALYEKKLQELQELNEEMTAEACRMQLLLGRKLELEIQINEAAQSEDAADENIDSLTNIKSSDDIEILQRLQVDLQEVEVNIDRMSRDMGLYNADLEDLAMRIESGATGASIVGGDASAVRENDSFESLGRDIICEFQLI